MLSNASIDSVYATLEAANARSATLKSDGEKAKVEVQELVGGSVTATAEKTTEKAAKPKLEPKKEKGIKKERSVSPQKKKIRAKEEEDEEEDEEDEGEADAKPPPRKPKTKTPAEQYVLLPYKSPYP